MPEARINIGVYGDQRSAAAGQGAKEAVAGVADDYEKGQEKKIAREEREYITGERERVAKERVYKREEDFYVAADIADAGLGYEAGLEDLARADKTKFAAIAAKGADASPEERQNLRRYINDIKKISEGQNHLKKLVADYSTAIDTDGAISASTPPKIAQLLKDLAGGKGDFKPVRGEDGKVRLQGTDSEGNKVDYSYDQLQTLKFSPKYDINKSVGDDVKLIGKEIREYALAGGGTTTHTNTPALIQQKAQGIAESRLKSPHALYEIGAELGFTSEERDKILDQDGGDDIFRNQVTEAYTQRLMESAGASVTTDGTLTAAQSATAASRTQTANSIQGDFQLFSSQIRAGDTSTLTSVLQKKFDDPSIHTTLNGSNIEVRGAVGDLKSAKIQLAQGKTLRALDGTIITASNIGSYDDEKIAGASYEVASYDVNSPEGNKSLFNEFAQGRGYSPSDLNDSLPAIGGINKGLGIITPDLPPQEVINQAIVEELSSATPLSVDDSKKFRELVSTKGTKTKAGAFASAFTELTGEVPEFLAGPGGTISDEYQLSGFKADHRGQEKIKNAMKAKLDFLNKQKGTNYTIENLMRLKNGEKLDAKGSSVGYKKYQTKK